MRKLTRMSVGLLFAGMLFGACSNNRTDTSSSNEKSPFVTVKDGEFYIGDSIYRYVGANFWYGPLLASEGYGDRDRLSRELDYLKELGIDNLRVLVGGDGNEAPSHISPILQPRPGEYNDTILQGLDYFISELEKRDMKAVLYLNNAWEWSGGYGTYLEWAGEGKAPDPTRDGYREYVDFVSKFVRNDSAKNMALDHVRNIVSRTNTVTGQPYSESPAIMSWQIANEPRPFAKESKEPFAEWIHETAKLIKSIDPNHLVSTGNEGYFGCEVDIDLWTRIHSFPEVDYATIHIWPYNWRWIRPEFVAEDIDTACVKTGEYMLAHYEKMNPIGKPIVLEEFGYPRDSMAIAIGTPTTGRDKYYEYVFSVIRDSGMINGSNFWSWGGFGNPAHRTWQPGDDYTGDPAQEDQGLNSVFASDSTTTAVIRRMAKDIRDKKYENSSKQTSEK